MGYLSPAKKAVLLSIVQACKFSVNKRCTIERLVRFAPDEYRSNHKAFKKMVKKLIRKGYIREQPSGQTTYKITTYALEAVSDMTEEL